MYTPRSVLAPEEARQHCALGVSLMDDGPDRACEVALADLDRALRLQPGNPDLLFHRGHAYEALGRYGDAMADYRAALGYAGADHDALLDGLARCESALGEGEDSLK